jgi:hypothetical protein
MALFKGTAVDDERPPCHAEDEIATRVEMG